MGTPIQQPASETAIADLIYELHVYLSTISALTYGAKNNVNDLNAFDIYSIIEPAESKSKKLLELIKRRA
ncbi:MAG: hypothetical protein GY862_01805 [Gammaproteobacteria bacterium]|nr:hypothetical protein [Gammaproteobacteria bacterium]